MTADPMPDTIRQVVAGVDGSEAATHAALWAAREAEIRGVPLTLVHALGITEGAAPTAGAAGAPGAPAHPLEPDPVLDAALTAIGAHHPEVPTAAQRSALPPAERLTELTGPGTLVVVGTRGHGSFVGMLLGSVSRALVKHTRGPLIVVRGPRAGRNAGRVVLGIGSDPAPETVRFAFAAAHRYGAGLLAVRTRPPLLVSPGMPPAIDLPVVMPAGGGIRSTALPQQAHLQEEFDRAAEREQALVGQAIEAARTRYPDVPVDIACTEGDPATTLAADGEDARLVVLGAPHRRHHGPLSKLLAHCPAPVAVVPEQPPPAQPAPGSAGRETSP
jgi:nucleotide-binding universal stress UspA family protein